VAIPMVEQLKRYELPGIHQIPKELISDVLRCTNVLITMGIRKNYTHTHIYMNLSVNTHFSQPKDNLFPPELSIKTFFILKVSSLHAAPNPILPYTG
jgi:hypothetical protein